MFPDAWTPAELIAAVLEARAVAHVIGAVRDEVDGARTWVGTGRGVRIEAVQDAAGRILAVRPTLDQPTLDQPALDQPPLGRSTPAAGAPVAPPVVVATGPEVPGWFQLDGSWQPVVTVARLLDRGQVNFHVELRIRLAGAVGTDQEALDAFGAEVDRLNRSALEHPDLGTGRHVTTGVRVQTDPDAVEVTVHPDGRWSLAGGAPTPARDLGRLLPPDTTAQHLGAFFARLDPYVLRLVDVTQPWTAVPGLPESSMVMMREAYPLPQRPVWPAETGLPDLGLSQHHRDAYDAALGGGGVVEAAGRYLTRGRPRDDLPQPVLRGSDELTYLARRRAPAGTPTAPIDEVMFPASWSLDDVRQAAVQMLHDPAATSPVPGQDGVVRLDGLPRLPVEVTVRRTAQGMTVLGIAPAAPTHWHRLARAVQAAGISEAQRAVLPRRAHDETRLAFALAQIADHPMDNGPIDTAARPDGAGPAQTRAHYGRFAGVFAGVVLDGATPRYWISTKADFTSNQHWLRPRWGWVDFPDDGAGIPPAQREILRLRAEGVAGLVRRYPYQRRFWTVHIGVGAGPVTDAAGERARIHRAEAVRDELRPMLAAALGPDLAATVRYTLHNHLGEVPAAASDVTAGAPTGARVVLWLDPVADLPGAAPAAAERSETGWRTVSPDGVQTDLGTRLDIAELRRVIGVTGRSGVSDALRTALANVPRWDGVAGDCVDRVMAVLRQLSLPASASDDQVGVLGPVGGWFGADFVEANRDQLALLDEGGVTVAEVAPPDGNRHVVLVERQRGGRFTLVETQGAEGPEFVPFDPVADSVELPPSWRGSVRLLRDRRTGGLAQLAPDPAALPGEPSRTDAALLDPATGPAGMRRPPLPTRVGEQTILDRREVQTSGSASETATWLLPWVKSALRKILLTDRASAGVVAPDQAAGGVVGDEDVHHEMAVVERVSGAGAQATVRVNARAIDAVSAHNVEAALAELPGWRRRQPTPKLAEDLAYVIAGIETAVAAGWSVGRRVRGPQPGCRDG